MTVLRQMVGHLTWKCWVTDLMLCQLAGRGGKGNPLWEALDTDWYWAAQDLANIAKEG